MPINTVGQPNPKPFNSPVNNPVNSIHSYAAIVVILCSAYSWCSRYGHHWKAMLTASRPVVTLPGCLGAVTSRPCNRTARNLRAGVSRLNSSISCDVLIVFASPFLFARFFISFVVVNFASCDICEATFLVGRWTWLKRRGSPSSSKMLPSEDEEKLLSSEELRFREESWL